MNTNSNDSNDSNDISLDTLDLGLNQAILDTKLGVYKPYDSQLPIAEIAGTRIVKCLYQKNKSTGKKKQESSYVRIPCQHLSEELIISRVVELSPYILSYLQEQEDIMIKEEHSNGLLSVYTDKLNLDLLIERLEASQESARLTKDKIESWFVAYLQDSLALLFAEKISPNPNVELNDSELAKLELILEAYKKKFASLAAGKTFIKEADCLSMISVIESSEEVKESLIGRRFITRLEKMKSKTDDTLMSL